MRHVLIVGLPGAGKSKLLEMCRSNLPNTPCFDLDREIEKSLGLDPLELTQWILNRPGGMDRELELACLLAILQHNLHNSCIISLGGGALDLFLEQQRSLSELGPIDWVYVEADLESILEQLMRDQTRPHVLMGDREFWRAKLNKRMQFFSTLPQVQRAKDHGHLLKLIHEMLRSDN